MKTIDDYPYDPKANPRYLRGLDLLRAEKDPAMREAIWRSYWAFHPYERPEDDSTDFADNYSERKE